LLKILEEPPATAILILATTRRGAMMPTILSRVRPYVFIGRDAETERDVIRRVFRDAAAADALEVTVSAGPSDPASNRVAAYLDSFLPVTQDALDAAAAFFAASAAAAAVPIARSRSGGAVSPSLVALGRAAALRAEAAGMGRPVADPRAASAAALEKAGKFEPRSLFPVFLERLLRLAAIPLRDEANGSAASSIAAAWAEAARRAENAVGTYNQAPALALERFFLELAEGAAGRGKA
jgi:DNA polymerase III subunit gamma/tau